MNNLEQQSKVNLSDNQKHLIKYCYANVTSLQEDTRKLIAECDDDCMIVELRYLFDTFILPYFFKHRTVFDRIRNYFVKYMNIRLSINPEIYYDKKVFLLQYSDFCKISGALLEDATRDTSIALMSKVKQIILDEF